VTGLCDRIAVLALGEVIAQGTPAEVWRNQLVADAYLGVEGA
jgi:branched-chain amino acid transport system ATP-binding protein